MVGQPDIAWDKDDLKHFLKTKCYGLIWDTLKQGYCGHAVLHESVRAPAPDEDRVCVPAASKFPLLVARISAQRQAPEGPESGLPKTSAPDLDTDLDTHR
jgi:hypothetical protein